MPRSAEEVLLQISNEFCFPRKEGYHEIACSTGGSGRIRWRLRRRGSWAVKSGKRSFAVVSILFAVLPSLSAGILDARDADFASRTFAAAQTAKQKCANTCRARYHDCQSRKEIPSVEKPAPEPVAS